MLDKDNWNPDMHKREISRTLGLFEQGMRSPKTFGREDLKKYIKNMHGVKISHLTATEGIVFSRGEEMEAS